MDQSHRCSGPLQQLLHDLVSNRGVSNECWILLQQRLLTAANPRLADPHFAPAVSPVGVLRHSICALKTLQRAQAAAAAMGRLLLLSVAADRCTFANRPLALTSELAQEADAVHILSAAANLPGILALYPGVELCLETKVCSELGVVRGCPVLVEDILLPENEPFLILHLLYHFFTLFCFPFVLYSCLVLRRLPLLAHASTEVLRPQIQIYHLIHFCTFLLPYCCEFPLRLGSSILPLAPEAFSSAPRRTLGDFNPARPPPEGFHFDSDQKAYLQLHRCQLPLTNTFAMTHDNLQGQTLPSIILDLAKPPKMSAVSRPTIFSFPFCSRDTFAYLYPPKWAQDEYWIACLVLLSRVPSLDDILFLRLPDLHALQRPRPDYIRNAYAHFATQEKNTIRRIDAVLHRLHLDHLRQSITLPLLATSNPPELLLPTLKTS